MLDDYRFIQITALAIGGGGQVVLYALDGSGTVWKLQDRAGEREPWVDWSGHFTLHSGAAKSCAPYRVPRVALTTVRGG